MAEREERDGDAVEMMPPVCAEEEREVDCELLHGDEGEGAIGEAVGS